MKKRYYFLFIIGILALDHDYSFAQVTTTTRPGYSSFDDKLKSEYAIQIDDKFKFDKSYGKTLKNIKTEFQLNRDTIDQELENNLQNNIDVKEAKKTRSERLKTYFLDASNKYAITFENFANKNNMLLFPTRSSRGLGRYYYSGLTDKSVEVLKNNYFNINTSLNSGAIYSELVAGYLGGFRISFGGMVSQAELETIDANQVATTNNLDSLISSVQEKNAENQTLQNILSGGGNALINVSIPVLFYQTPNRDFIGSLTFFERVGFLLPEIGTSSEDIDPTNSFGLMLDNWIDLNFLGEESFALIIRGTGQVFSNKEYAKSIGIADTNTFAFAELALGFEMARQFRVTLNLPYLITETEKGSNPFQPTITINLIPF